MTPDNIETPLNNGTTVIESNTDTSAKGEDYSEFPIQISPPSDNLIKDSSRDDTSMKHSGSPSRIVETPDIKTNHISMDDDGTTFERKAAHEINTESEGVALFHSVRVGGSSDNKDDPNIDSSKPLEHEDKIEEETGAQHVNDVCNTDSETTSNDSEYVQENERNPESENCILINDHDGDAIKENSVTSVTNSKDGNGKIAANENFDEIDVVDVHEDVDSSCFELMETKGEEDISNSTTVDVEKLQAKIETDDVIATTGEGLDHTQPFEKRESVDEQVFVERHFAPLTSTTGNQSITDNEADGKENFTPKDFVRDVLQDINSKLNSDDGNENTKITEVAKDEDDITNSGVNEDNNEQKMVSNSTDPNDKHVDVETTNSPDWDGLSLHMSVKEMKEKLSERRKKDPRKFEPAAISVSKIQDGSRNGNKSRQVNFDEKFKIFDSL